MRVRWEQAAILLIAAHSVALGLALLVDPLDTLRLAQWPYAGDLFWPSQAGLFLLVLGLVYGATLVHRPLVWLIVLSKAVAFLFLAVHALWLGAPRLALAAGVGDGLMGLVAWVVARRPGARLGGQALDREGEADHARMP